jgi:hypothetical protein
MCCFFKIETRQYSFWQAVTTRRYLRTVPEKTTADQVVMEACGPRGRSRLAAAAAILGKPRRSEESESRHEC